MMGLGLLLLAGCFALLWSIWDRLNAIIRQLDFIGQQLLRQNQPELFDDD